MMIGLLGSFFVIGIAMMAFARHTRRYAFVLASLPLLFSLVLGVLWWPAVVDGEVREEAITWVGGLGLELGVRLDALGLLMASMVTVVGLAIVVYGRWYFEPTGQSARTAGLLVLFAGSMLTLVLADNVAFLYVGWELTSITSFLLIGGAHREAEARAAALHALLVTTAGGLALLAGLVLIAQAAGTWSLHAIVSAPPSGAAVTAGLVLVPLGIVTKSAQYPFHSWLPGAMVAPTPVSAFLHSATMVTAGIYLAARFAPAFHSPAWRIALVSVGLLTMLAGGLRALRQVDLKLLLAMGTISQLGFMLVLVGVGLPEATAAGLALLLAHALFKATLFLVVGVVDHQVHTRDLRELRGFGDGWQPVKAVTAIAAASMVGLPPLLGFVAKEAGFDAFVGEGPVAVVVLVGITAGSALTVAYTWRFVAPLLARPVPGAACAPAPPPVAVAPALVLTLLTVAGGVVVGSSVSPLVSTATSQLYSSVSSVELALWHGFGPPLLLTIAAFAGGALLVAARRQVDGLASALAPARTGADAYAATVRGLIALSRRVTSVVQPGSLPLYIAVILVTAVVVPGVALAGAFGDFSWPAWFESLAELPASALVVVAAVATAVARRRFVAVVCLGAVGYGMALVFVFAGAPDVALTQFVIETVTIVAFMLVLRLLPDSFPQSRGSVARRFRLALSGVVAVGVFATAMASAGSPERAPVGEEAVDRAFADAGGSNVVNVVLVDFRGLDTLGELSVLAVAAVGVVALARVASRRPAVDAP